MPLLSQPTTSEPRDVSALWYRAQPKEAKPLPLVERLRRWSSQVLPHNTAVTTCPPGPLVCGPGPTILVASLRRSGTHLLLDLLFNNFPGLRRSPLFVDFDAYARRALPLEPLADLSGVTVKAHFPEMPLDEAYLPALQALAERAVVLMPRRPAEAIRCSLAKWGFEYSVKEVAEIQERSRSFWEPFSPVVVDFSELLDPAGVARVVRLVAARTGLPCPAQPPVMPARHRLVVYGNKALTRLLGARAARINTTIGYRLRRQPTR